MPRRVGQAGWVGVGLFFVTVVAFAADSTLPSRYDELKVIVEKLREENGQLKTGVAERDEAIRKLTENMAIARTESEFFQKKWNEAQLRAQMLGVNPSDDAAAKAQRQLIESIRAFYLEQAERQRLVEQMKRLLAALDANKDVSDEVQKAKQLIAANEYVPPSATEKTGGQTLTAAQIVDVNPKLQLVVLNVGLAQGTRVGMPFVVVRGDQIVAELRIVEVRRRICGAVIEKVEKGVTLAVGDHAQVTKS